MCQFTVDRPLHVAVDPSEANGNGKGAEDVVQIVCFPDRYETYRGKIEKGAPVLLDVERLPDGGMNLKRLFRLDEIIKR